MLYFLNKPASCAIHGSDWDMTRAEWMPMSLSAPDTALGENNDSSVAIASKHLIMV
jgi:hypothetical protein